MTHALVEALIRDLGAQRVRAEEPLARYTSLRVGGPAEVLVFAHDLAALVRAMSLGWSHGVRCRVLGAGSNVLVSDAGVHGLTVINRARRVTFETSRVWADSGASFSTLARRAIDRHLSGLEWATGIPGTVGGAVAGNAGAWGGDVASTLSEARVLLPAEPRQGEPGTGAPKEARWDADRFGYGYRTSVLRRASEQADRAPQPVVLAAAFRVEPGDPAAMAKHVSQITAERRTRQPQGATCGSVFKNPPGDYAGRLVEAAGLKGATRGGAMISPVHANFFVNTGGATAADLKSLIDLARQTAYGRFGVKLELEIELLGKW